jgi:hypothetical protein
LAASNNGPFSIVRIVGAERYTFAFVFRAQHVELHADPPVSIAAKMTQCRSRPEFTTW